MYKPTTSQLLTITDRHERELTTLAEVISQQSTEALEVYGNLDQRLCDLEQLARAQSETIYGLVRYILFVNSSPKPIKRTLRDRFTSRVAHILGRALARVLRPVLRALQAEKDRQERGL